MCSGQHFLAVFITFQPFSHFLAVLALLSGISTFQRFQHFSAVLAFFQRFQHFLAVLALFSGFSTFQRFHHFLAVLTLFSGFSTFYRFQHFLALLAHFSGFRTIFTTIQQVEKIKSILCNIMLQRLRTIFATKHQAVNIQSDSHRIDPLGQFGLVVAMSVCCHLLCVVCCLLSPSHAIFQRGPNPHFRVDRVCFLVGIGPAWGSKVEP